MASAHPQPAAGEALAGETSGRSAPTAEVSAGQAMVPVPRQAEEEEEIAFSTEVMRLPVELDVAVPVRDFRVRHLLGYGAGPVDRVAMGPWGGRSPGGWRRATGVERV